MKKAILISVLFCLLCSCSRESARVESGYGWLCIEDIAQRGGDVVVSTLKSVSEVTKGGVDPDFGINILTSDGQPVQGCSYAPGEVPGKIQLPSGDYRIEAFSGNINSWRTAFSGRGAAAYRAEGTFEIEADMYKYVKIQAPLVNYGICFKVEEGLYDWFKSFSLAVTENQSRKVTLSDGQSGWFDAATVSVVITAVNTDNDSFSGNPYILNASSGHLYTLNYSLSPSEDGSFSVEISIDDSFGDAGEEQIIIN